MAKVTIKGFHGTDARNVENILENNFNSSEGDAEWLGDGAYFFVDGIAPPPINNATKWGIATAWDNARKRYKYTEYAVLQATIEVGEEYFLDLTTPDGIEVFNYLRNKYIEAILKAGKTLKRGEFQDGHIINDARMNLKYDIDVVKGRFYIKFTKERVFNINFRIPNCTIVAVFDVDRNIALSSIKVVKQKTIQR